MTESKFSTKKLLLILGLIILLVPPILTQPAFLYFFNFSSTGEIGDTIGGITAPFINAIGAILVFVAFKEQIKANNLIKEQQYFQHIQEQIHRLEDDFLDLPEVIREINNGISTSKAVLNNYENGKLIAYGINRTAINKAIYSTLIFDLTINLIEKVEKENRLFLFEKLKALYSSLYYDNYRRINVVLTKMHSISSSTKNLEEKLLSYINHLEIVFQLREEE